MPNQNIKEDLFEIANPKQINDFKHNYIMAALVAIKINIVLKMEEVLRDVKKQEKTNPFNNSIIESNLVKELMEQREHLDGYIEALKFHELDEIVLQRERHQIIVNNYDCHQTNCTKSRMLFGETQVQASRIIWTYFNRLFCFKPESLNIILNTK